MTIKKYDNSAIDLSRVSFGDYSGEYTFEEALSNGMLVNVTSWVRHEMGFGESRYRVEVAVTARLWKTIVCVSPLAKVWQSVVGRGRAGQMARFRGRGDGPRALGKRDEMDTVFSRPGVTLPGQAPAHRWGSLRRRQP